MPKLNVFQDKDGDFVITDADAVAPGISAFQLSGSDATAISIVKWLQEQQRVTLWLNVGKLAHDSGPTIDALQHKLVLTQDVDEDDTVYAVLASLSTY